MITNNHSWSLGSCSDKSFEPAQGSKFLFAHLARVITQFSRHSRTAYIDLARSLHQNARNGRKGQVNAAKGGKRQINADNVFHKALSLSNKPHKTLISEKKRDVIARTADFSGTTALTPPNFSHIVVKNCRLMNVRIGFLALLITLSTSALGALQSNTSLKNELERAIERGADWLVKNQQDKGYWSTTDHPAVTALALVAFQGKPSLDADEKSAVRKGYDFLLQNIHDDGTIHADKGLINYNTSIGLLALVAARNSDYKSQIHAARKYLIGTQIDMGEKGKLDTRFDGGVGYGSKYEHSDMANTLQALEALYYSKQFTTDSPDKQDLDYKAAIHFLQNCQNLPSHNPQSSTDPLDLGGFVYHPEESKAGTNTINGRVALRSYGSISYAGLLSYIYADLDKSDPRVKAVLEWLEKNYTLEENPGMGEQGLYYYYHTMAKALSAYGLDELPTKNGPVKWREQLALRLLNLQKRDGSWENNNGRWFEKDPALVTSYAMLTLEMIAREI